MGIQSNHVGLRTQEYQADFSAAANVNIATETAVAAAQEGITPPVNADWEYSAIAENRLGEIAVDNVDLDEAPGVIYSGKTGNAVRVKAQLIFDTAAIIAPSATDVVTIGLYQNNVLHTTCAEGTFTELDNEVADIANIDTMVTLVEGDVLHIAVKGLDESAETDLDMVIGGHLVIV